MNHFAVHQKCKSTIRQLKKKSWVPSYPSLDFIVHIKASLYNILLLNSFNFSPSSLTSVFHKPSPSFRKKKKKYLIWLPPPFSLLPASFLPSTSKFLKLHLATVLSLPPAVSLTS